MRWICRREDNNTVRRVEFPTYSSICLPREKWRYSKRGTCSISWMACPHSTVHVCKLSLALMFSVLSQRRGADRVRLVVAIAHKRATCASSMQGFGLQLHVDTFYTPIAIDQD